MEDLRVGVFSGPVLADLLAASFPSGSVQGAQAKPDLSGIYWATEYNAKIQIVGGGELPLTAAGEAGYDKNIAGLEDGSVTGAGRKELVPEGVAHVLGQPSSIRNS